VIKQIQVTRHGVLKGSRRTTYGDKVKVSCTGLLRPVQAPGGGGDSQDFQSALEGCSDKYVYKTPLKSLLFFFQIKILELKINTKRSSLPSPRHKGIQEEQKYSSSHS
jgi:hypothetical protein